MTVVILDPHSSYYGKKGEALVKNNKGETLVELPCGTKVPAKEVIEIPEKSDAAVRR